MSLLFWRTESFQSAPSRRCWHGKSKRSILKLLLLNKFLYIFRKSHQIWLSYLSHSLKYGQKPQGWCRTPPPPPPRQDTTEDKRAIDPLTKRHKLVHNGGFPKSKVLDREASLIKKEYCRCGPHPYK